MGHCRVVFDTSSSELVWLYGVGQSIFGTVGWFVAVQCWYILLDSFVAVPRYVVLPWVHSSPELVWRCGLVQSTVGSVIRGWLLCIWCGGLVWYTQSAYFNLAPRCC